MFDTSFVTSPQFEMLISVGIGYGIKYGENIIKKIHAFRNIVDSVDNMMNDPKATDENIKSVIANAQLL